MTLFRFRLNDSTGRLGETWPVVLLLFVVAVPTLGVLWFAAVAMENQQLATKQRLTEVYRGLLQNAKRGAEEALTERVRDCEAIVSTNDGRQATDAVVQRGLADAAVRYDEHGQLRFATHVSPHPDPAVNNDVWRNAQRLENQLSRFDDASKMYAQVAVESSDPLIQALAVQSQARCEFKAGHATAMVNLVTNELAEDRFANQQNPQVASILANIELMALESCGDPNQADRIANRVARRLHIPLANSNTEPPSEPLRSVIPGSQRLFLMRHLRELRPDLVSEKLLKAVQLSDQFASAHATIPQSKTGTTVRSDLNDLWQLITSNRTTVFLWTTSSMASFLDGAVAENVSLPDNVQIAFRPTSDSSTSLDNFLTMPAGNKLPGWQLSVSLLDSNQVDDVGLQRSRLLLWAGILFVLLAMGLGLLIATAIRRQLRVANLKNDLVGTVTHELKTPLSSMRLLVDTLLEEKQLEEEPTREYLHLIAKENERLSRLIDNFLAFSRIDQDHATFDSGPIQVPSVISSAIEAAGVRLQPPQCELTVNLDDDLPPIRGDKDALVMVVLNLLDNACKYTSHDRKIQVTAVRREDRVLIAVNDNGQGISPKDQRRIFDRFYQVDQSLARKDKGCGLGLSIVNQIVRAHGGTVSVESSLNVGSTFTISLPAVMSDQSGLNADSEGVS